MVVHPVQAVSLRLALLLVFRFLVPTTALMGAPALVRLFVSRRVQIVIHSKVVVQAHVVALVRASVGFLLARRDLEGAVPHAIAKVDQNTCRDEHTETTQTVHICISQCTNQCFPSLIKNSTQFIVDKRNIKKHSKGLAVETPYYISLI